MNPILTSFKAELAKIIFQLKEELKTVRTGRASPAILETLVVDTYGGQSKLKLLELATILTEGPAVLSISPYDPSTVTDIEKAILKSPLGLSPQVTGTKILIRIPPLSQEQREKLTKLVNQMVEEKRSYIRNVRDETRKKIKTSFDKKDLPEDDKFRLEKETDSLTQKTNSEIQTIKESKEQELMEV